MEKNSLINVPIRNWALDDMPREKLLSKGLLSLSNAELIAILLNVGSREKSALDLAHEVLAMASNNLDELGKLSLFDLQKILGMGEAKSALIMASLELGRRRHSCSPIEKICVRNSTDIAHYLKTVLKDYSYEVFAVLFLNRANKIKHFEIVSRGGITGTVADPRLILKKAVEQEATSLILSHNHPSGNLQPSQADQDITQKIKQAASYFDIRVLDHIIVSDEGYFSFADEGLV